jgi:hypothetical protein
MKRRTVLSGLVGVGALSGVVGRVGAAAPITVPDDYTSIQAAVDNADPGGTVVVDGKAGDGTYREQVIVRKDLTVRGKHDPTLLPPDGSLGVRDIAVIQPIFGAVGYGNEVTVEGVTIDGEGATDKGGFYSCVGYYKADGKISDITARGADYGGYISQNRGGGGSQDVTVRDSRFEELGLGRGNIGETQLVFNEPGTTGKVTNSTFVATPDEYPLIYGVNIGYGASVDVQQNTFRKFYSEGGFGVGTYAFNAPDCTIQKNTYEACQYPIYVTASSRVQSDSADKQRIIKNTIDGEELPDAVTSYGTTLYAFDTNADDGRQETVNNVKVINNDYSDLTYGVASFTSGEGVIQNTKIIRNEFENIAEAEITTAGDVMTKTQANRLGE